MRMITKYTEVGICGLSCRLCPNYQTEARSRCAGCKSKTRIAVGCPFISCAIKKKGVEFCWDCIESNDCEKWKRHRDAGKKYDTFKCYQKLEDNICFIRENGVDKFEEVQKVREQLLKYLLKEFNEGRSKSYYCITATILTIEELKEAIDEVGNKAKGLDIKAKSRLMHTALDNIASRKGYQLKLRK